jgi:hypothetical protein
MSHKTLATCKLLELAWKQKSLGGFVSLTQNIPKLENVGYLGNMFDKEEVAGHTLTLLKIIRSCGGRMDSTGGNFTSPNARKNSAFQGLESMW